MNRELALAEIERARASLAAATAALADDVAQPEPAPVAPAQPHGGGLSKPAAFFAALKASRVLGETLEQTEVDGCNAILAACAGWPVSWTADALATADLETRGTMQPVREAFWLSDAAAAAWARKMYDIEGARPAVARELGNLTPGDGVKYMGRGYPQMTGRKNYARFEQLLGIPLLSDPDLALQPAHAAAIMRRGMEDGLFTGKSLNDYLPAIANREQFKNARRVINGQDRAEEIADIAVAFQAALQAGGWA